MFSSLQFQEPTCGLKLDLDLGHLPSIGEAQGSTPSATNKIQNQNYLCRRGLTWKTQTPPCLQNCPLASIWNRRVEESF